ncbi:TPA: hypothetical protein I7682_18055 [Vibrio vulnificus]|nr:hypothetical protein [Vibrio vulnificus]
MNNSHDFYAVVALVGLAFSLLHLAPAFLNSQTRKIREQKEDQRRARAEQRKEELHQAKLEQMKTPRDTHKRREHNKSTTPRVDAKSTGYQDRKHTNQRSIVGRIVEHDSAHYRFDERENMSYFAKIATSNGEVTIWGVGLKEALKGVSLNQRVKLCRESKKNVIVKENVLSDEGNVIDMIEKNSFRQEWKCLPI